MNSEKGEQVDYAAAARAGISSKPRVVVPSDSPRRVAIEDCLREASRQLRDDLGWSPQFKIELSCDSGLVAIYHLSISSVRKHRWWSWLDWVSDDKYLGTIVFRNSNESGWTIPVGAPIFETLDFATVGELPQSLVKFFASPEVGKILRELFGKVRK